MSKAKERRIQAQSLMDHVALRLSSHCSADSPQPNKTQFTPAEEEDAGSQAILSDTLKLKSDLQHQKCVRDVLNCCA